MSKALRQDSNRSYQSVVRETAELLQIPPEDVNKIIRKFWRGLELSVIFGLCSITIERLGKIVPTTEHRKKREVFLKMGKKIFNRRTEDIYGKKRRKKSRILLFSEHH